ncbi:hypothetical protein [Methylorubrum suomiense]|uniref:Uncharacterized protein n=1 Tax=Methylorubrum suomiense TaxID=144191 RepID=A0ABQ4UQ14_9HYPH|nr:hypothetical protein [Methylorubrum suomiense]GJE74337.1 hypothetical protein BGCPKDLD_0906 [Methylorubrum suomiense]
MRQSLRPASSRRPLREDEAGPARTRSENVAHYLALVLGEPEVHICRPVDPRTQEPMHEDLAMEVWARSHDEARIIWQQAVLADHFDAIPDGALYLLVETTPLETVPTGRRKPLPANRSGYHVDLLNLAFLAELEPEVVRARSLGI